MTHIGDPTFDGYLNFELQRALNIVGSSGVRLMVATFPIAAAARNRRRSTRRTSPTG
ncbi:putative acyltransferase 3 [Mycobacterium kansasii]|uniref:Putative acyltransferase 3 n=1 Tax=Mycobacterium kansasii TaxID=1768 RepID=A0A1V3WAW9_MYCKA|nr:putative acyltransferase 3 [Mycobacterium kansasii]